MTQDLDALPLPDIDIEGLAFNSIGRDIILEKVHAHIRAARREGYELAMRKAQEGREPVAWRTFDGEGGYEYRSYEDNEDYADVWMKRNPRHKGWVEPLYTAPPPKSDEPIPVTDDASAVAYLEWALWKFIDMAGTCPSAKVDPRTWAHVMVYAPKSDEAMDALIKAARWFADNPDSPRSALGHITEALAALAAQQKGGAA